MSELPPLHQANALLGHWMGGINPCACQRCKDVAAVIERAEQAEAENERLREEIRTAPQWVRTMLKERVAALEAAKWAAEVNADESMQSASEAWARCAELVEMLEGRKPVDAEMITKLKEHRAHVVECRKGSCEHEYASLVRAGLVAALARHTPAPEGKKG